MKRAIYVDYENVSLHGLEAIEQLGSDDNVKIFIGTQSTRLSMEDADRIFNCEANVELITNKYIGKNALDFIIMVYMGYDIAKGLANAYFVVSNDKGYDPAIYQMRKLSGLTVQRKADISFVLKEKINESISVPEEKTETVEKKKGFGRRLLGILGIGKEKEEPAAEEPIEEIATETVVIGKDDSVVRDKVLNELVGESKPQRGRNGNRYGSRNNNRYGQGRRSNERKPKQAEAKTEAKPETKPETKPEKKTDTKRKTDGRNKQQEKNKLKPADNKPEAVENKKNESAKNINQETAENNKPETAENKNEAKSRRQNRRRGRGPSVKKTDNQAESTGNKEVRQESNAGKNDAGNTAADENASEEKKGRRKVTRRVSGKKAPEKPVKTPEELERERQRDEAFALLKELHDEQ